MQEAEQNMSLASTLSLNWPYAFARGNEFPSKNLNGKRYARGSSMLNKWKADTEASRLER